MPFNPDGTFSLVERLGTGTPMDNMLPPLIGADLDDIAAALTNLPASGKVPCFKANKAGIDQSIPGSTFTTVIFNALPYLINSTAAANAWTPPAGKIHLTATIYLASGVTSIAAIQIQKNGASLQQLNFTPFSGQGSTTCSVDDACNGTDAYSVAIFADGTPVISGNVTLTSFSGYWFSA